MNPQEYLTGTLSGPKWDFIGTRKRSGILAPLFSVYSEKSAGIGDFADLRLLVDWAGLTGNSIIQLLPMNDLGSGHCPYDATSSFALESAFLCLEESPVPEQKIIKKEVSRIKKIYPTGGKYVDYGIKQEK